MKKKFLVSGLIASCFIISLSFAHWADQQIGILKDNNVLDKVFESEIETILNNPITREEFFSLMAVAKNVSSEVKPKDFTDYGEINSKYVPYINGLITEGIVAGSLENDNLYINPKHNITRQEASVILSKMLYLNDEEYTLAFIDNNDIAPWALPYIKGAVKGGIISGYPDGTVKPKNNITIAEAICIVGNSYTMGYMKNGEIYAGTLECGSKNGLKLHSSFSSPMGLAKRDDTIFVVDKNSNMVRNINGDQVTTFVGSDIGRDEYNEAIGSFKDGEKALFDAPSYIAKAGNGFFVTDTGNNMIRFINSDGYTTTYAGNKNAGYKDGKGQDASFDNPTGIVVDLEGNVYVADTNNNVIRKIDANRNVTTYAGNENAGFKDGNVKEAKFNAPVGLWYANDTLYVADSGNQRIRMIKDNIVTTVAGGSTDIDENSGEYIGGFIDGECNVAEFNFPMAIVSDVDKNLYVADYGNGVIRKISFDGKVSTLKIDGLKRPAGLLITEDGLFVSDKLMNAIYRIQNY
ncbi:MAG: S-layer homology domain-containing protein [Clostridia bacterium]|nr:S-layer homology domain-containing protein [Clostridia bacterium]